MRITNALLGAWLLVLGGCAPSALRPLVVDGRELHASLVTRSLDGAPIRHVERAVLCGNPCLSSERAFVEQIARSGSQGKLDGEGIRAALYAL